MRNHIISFFQIVCRVGPYTYVWHVLIVGIQHGVVGGGFREIMTNHISVYICVQTIYVMVFCLGGMFDIVEVQIATV